MLVVANLSVGHQPAHLVKMLVGKLFFAKINKSSHVAQNRDAQKWSDLDSQRMDRMVKIKGQSVIVRVPD